MNTAKVAVTGGRIKLIISDESRLAMLGAMMREVNTCPFCGWLMADKCGQCGWRRGA